MKNIVINYPEVKLVGIQARTNNASEMNPLTAKIPPTIQKYMYDNVPAKILNRLSEGVNYCVYTDYETGMIVDPTKCDYKGDYSYFIGEAVSSFEGVSDHLMMLTIPAQNYVKFTTTKGAMPSIVINAWMEIWNMTSGDLGGERSYTADFEIYDTNTLNMLDTEVDIYIGIK